MASDALSLLALAQPYIRPRSRRHSRTGRHHTAIARATVVVVDGQPRCIDVCAVLAASPHDTAVGRDALVITGNDEPAILAVHDDEADPIRQAAELFVTRMEDAVRLRFPRPGPVDMLRTEVELLVHMLDTTSDGPVTEAWNAHHETSTGYEALMKPDRCDRDSTS